MGKSKVVPLVKGMVLLMAMLMLMAGLESSALRPVSVSLVGEEAVGVGVAPPKLPPNLPTAFYDPNATLPHFHHFHGGSYGNYSGGGSGGGFSHHHNGSNQYGQLWYDEDKQGMRIDTVSVETPGYPQNQSTVVRNATTFSIDNGLCKPGPGPFQSLFSWVANSTYQGQVMVGERLCDEWLGEIPSLGAAALYVLSNSSDDGVAIPVQLVLPNPGNSTYSNGTSNSTYLFSEQLVIAPIDPSVWEVTDWNPTCAAPLVCEGSGTIVETMYLFHSANDFTLINTNIADLLGDVVFVCHALGSQHFDYFTWISQYTVMLNTSWGEYCACNFGQCVGGSLDRVGREGPLGLGPLTGQCSNNSQTGSWYSFPAYNASLCSEEYANGTIGINGTEWFGCGWNVVDKLKTINGSCLESHGFFNVCTAIGDLPSTDAANLFALAFASDDPALGGCPDIYPYHPAVGSISKASQTMRSDFQTSAKESKESPDRRSAILITT